MTRIEPTKQRAFATEVAQKLRDAGYDSLWAGGCVRDQLLGRQAKDIDVATNATPDQVRNLFGRRRTLAIGAAFGVISVIGPRDSGNVEVATFRKDAEYSDGRHPDHVTFSTAEEDAQRRDFTINGLFFDPLDERVIDYVGGQEDIQQGIVRAIGDPNARLSEDKLRMLRGIRFAATLEFDLDPATWRAIEAMAPQLDVVSAERIAAEMRRMLVDNHRVRAMTLLRDSGLLRAVLPAAIDLESDDSWTAAVGVMAELDQPSFSLALAAMLICLTDHQGAAAVGTDWKLSNPESARATWLVGHQTALDGAENGDWPTIQRLLIHKGSRDLVALLAARAACGMASDRDLAFCQARLDWPSEQLNPPPLITGDDLIAHGVPAGKSYRGLLTAVRDAQLNQQIATRDEALNLVDRLRAK